MFRSSYYHSVIVIVFYYDLTNHSVDNPQLNGAKVMNSSSRRRNSIATNEEPLSRMWAAVRNNNGIMVSLLTSPMDLISQVK